jgi:hypothetical protein
MGGIILWGALVLAIVIAIYFYILSQRNMKDNAELAKQLLKAEELKEYYLERYEKLDLSLTRVTEASDRRVESALRSHEKIVKACESDSAKAALVRKLISGIQSNDILGLTKKHITKVMEKKKTKNSQATQQDEVKTVD